MPRRSSSDKISDERLDATVLRAHIFEAKLETPAKEDQICGRRRQVLDILVCGVPAGPKPQYIHT